MQRGETGSEIVFDAGASRICQTVQIVVTVVTFDPVSTSTHVARLRFRFSNERPTLRFVSTAGRRKNVCVQNRVGNR